MPEVTRDEAACGFVGLTVVFALRNRITPAMLNMPPIEPIASAATARMTEGTSKNGGTSESTHIAAHISSATAGGGTFSSSDFTMAPIRSDEISSRDGDDG